MHQYSFFYSRFFILLIFANTAGYAFVFEKSNLFFKGKALRIMAPYTPKGASLEKNCSAQTVSVVNLHSFDSRNHPFHFIDLAINSSFSFSLNVENSTFQPQSLTCNEGYFSGFFFASIRISVSRTL